ncbi:MAG: FtsH protease activity modulator HflK [Gammaproteobacteria bacterium]|nr:MAG: FtsH protease activity modulator HflK [Gammaproteobacteria bacterium]RLA13385.1 MAG: FtsH protease activity modulator HflK [Gammaproteobacteria bacterium]RLA16437.1 MAG: FtsH protease activity modulator HflK [Gammaproteobacteria bacterium]
MAWNEPGNSGDKDPWGNRDGKGPPDLDEVMKNLQKKVSGIFGGDKKGETGGSSGGTGGASGGLLIGALLVALVIWGFTGVYRISEGQQGVVLRFGEFQSFSAPGLHWHIPTPIEWVEVVDLGQLRAVEIGYRENSRTGQVGQVPRESLMLTKDENIIDIKFAVQYRIGNAKDYLFNIRDPEGTLQQVSEAAIRQQVGRTVMDSILSKNREQVAVAVKKTTQELLDRYQSGLVVTSVNMQDAQPPEQVQAAFDDAVKAREDKQRLINEAEAYRNDVLPRASGEAARVLAEANAYEATLVANALGVASRFTALREVYEQAPEVTRERLYLETMETVLSANRKVMIEGDAGNNMLYLPLDRLIKESDNVNSINLAPSRISQPAMQGTESRTVSRGRESR